MRKYQPIWEAIKASATNSITISAPTHEHAKIVQGVRKEKWRDSGTKLLGLNKYERFKILNSQEGSRITFKLVSEPVLSANTL